MKLRTAFCLWLLCMLPWLRGTSQPGYMDALKTAAQSMVHSLSPMQQRHALLAFDDTARIQWNNLPVGLRARAGISIGNMTEEQRKLLHRLLSVALSAQGYLKATSILHLDNLLNMYVDTAVARGDIKEESKKFLVSLQWSHQNYFLAFFGKPTDAKWGFKLEGHHLSVNLTFAGNAITVTPWFIGTDPAEMPTTQYAGWRVLGQEEDLGIELIKALTPDQQKKATGMGEVPGDIITGAETGKRLIDYWGIKGSDMNAAQQTLMDRIIREFVFNLEWPKALEEYDKIKKAGLDNVYFGWVGPYDEYKAHYFVLNGPTFLIEFDNAGGPMRRGNHIHAIWREKGNEFGEDMLKKHYQQEKH